MANNTEGHQWLGPFMAIAVLGGWFASLAYSIVSNNFTALTATTPVMLLACGFAFGIRITRNKED